MESFSNLVQQLNDLVWSKGISIGGEQLPFVVLALLGTGVFLTIRLGFIQLRRFGHGVGVTTGKYDDPDEPGDVSHFQALATALSATVGIGNIAGVAVAIHFGGPGALFWMWVTAFLGMAVKYTEVTLAQAYRNVTGPDHDAKKWEGTVSGGPMYYIEKGMGTKWKPMAIFFAIMLGLTAFLTGNGIQANTMADTLRASFGVPTWITGLVSATLVATVILGGISRIGTVSGILAPMMALLYFAGAGLIILLNIGDVIPTFALIFREAFNPSAGVAGTGAGAILVTMMWGVKRGLFSNESGQGSAPIAHAAAKTDEPVSEGVVALLEPFIDTILICSMTGLVIIMTGAWEAKHPTEITLSGGNLSYVAQQPNGRYARAEPLPEITVQDGVPTNTQAAEVPSLAWYEAPVERLYVDRELQTPFNGVIRTATGTAVSQDGQTYSSLHGLASQTGAPMTMYAFRQGLQPLGDWGHYVVIISVLLFALSTAISWSYYGDRCANYVAGRSAILPYRAVYVLMHFVGAVLPLTVAWTLGDIFLGIVIFPNLIALIFLSGKVATLTKSYFDRKPWEAALAKNKAR